MTFPPRVQSLDCYISQAPASRKTCCFHTKKTKTSIIKIESGGLKCSSPCPPIHFDNHAKLTNNPTPYKNSQESCLLKRAFRPKFANKLLEMRRIDHKFAGVERRRIRWTKISSSTPALIPCPHGSISSGSDGTSSFGATPFCAHVSQH